MFFRLTCVTWNMERDGCCEGCSVTVMLFSGESHSMMVRIFSAGGWMCRCVRRAFFRWWKSPSVSVYLRERERSVLSSTPFCSLWFWTKTWTRLVMWSPSAEYRHTRQMLSSALEIWPLTFITVCLTFGLSPGLWRSAHRWRPRWKRPVVRCTTQTGNDPHPYRHGNWKWTATRHSRVWWWCLKKMKNLNIAHLWREGRWS